MKVNIDVALIKPLVEKLFEQVPKVAEKRGMTRTELREISESISYCSDKVESGELAVNDVNYICNCIAAVEKYGDIKVDQKLKDEIGYVKTDDPIYT